MYQLRLTRRNILVLYCASRKCRQKRKKCVFFYLQILVGGPALRQRRAVAPSGAFADKAEPYLLCCIRLVKYLGHAKKIKLMRCAKRRPSSRVTLCCNSSFRYNSSVRDAYPSSGLSQFIGNRTRTSVRLLVLQSVERDASKMIDF